MYPIVSMLRLEQVTESQTFRFVIYLYAGDFIWLYYAVCVASAQTDGDFMGMK